MIMSPSQSSLSLVTRAFHRHRGEPSGYKALVCTEHCVQRYSFVHPMGPKADSKRQVYKLLVLDNRRYC